jgi:hypothetical protein
VANVFSIQIYDSHGGLPTNAAVNTSTCPAGFVWVVRDITAWYNPAGTGHIFGLYFNVLGTGTIFAGWYAGPAFAQWSYHWQGRQVLTAGQGVTINPGESNWHVRIAGYQLSLP